MDLSGEDPVNAESLRRIAEGEGVPIPPSEKKKRGPNWYSWEDLLVAKAWVSVSLDPSIGVGQKLKKFYTRVQQKFM